MGEYDYLFKKSWIFEFTKERKEEGAWIRPSRYRKEFPADQFELVSGITVRESALNSILSTPIFEGVASFNIDVLTMQNRDHYFQSKLDGFKITLKRLDEVTLNDFMMYLSHPYDPSINPNCASLLDALVQTYDYGKLNCGKYFVDDTDGEYGRESFDAFFRRARNGDVFYLGGVVEVNKK